MSGRTLAEKILSHRLGRPVEAGEFVVAPVDLVLALESGVALKGPVSTPVGEGFSSVNVALRQRLGLYANLRPVRSIPGVPSRYREWTW